MLDALSDLHFLRPWWLLAILPALGLAVLWARRRTGKSHWEDAVEPQLLAALLEPAKQSARHHLGWLLAIALLVGAVGLAGPTWQRLPQPVEQKNDALVVLFDLSLSMYAEDLSPSRLVRAKHKIADVLRRRDEGFTALIAFAGDAHTVSPLTDDTRTIENLLNALGPDTMPVLGSDTGAALDLAHHLFENAGIDRGRILLITDGIDRLADTTAHSDPRFPLSILGIGTPEGGLIPIASDSNLVRALAANGRLKVGERNRLVLQTPQGDTIHSPLDEDRLRTAAQLGHGRYSTLAVGDADIDHLLGVSLAGEDETVDIEREFDTWADAGYWLALVLLPLLLLGFRRGLLACLALVLLPPPPAQANLWDDLWQRRDQQAFEALREGRPEEAAQRFDDPAWRNAANYRSEQYEAAAQGWATQSRNPQAPADEHYNLGNALAHLGDFGGAIDAYDRALETAPNHEDAAFNKALLEKLQQQQQEASEQDNREQQSQGGNDAQNQRQPQDGAPHEPPSEDQQQQAEQNPNEGEQQQQSEQQQSEAGAEQQQQAQAGEDEANRDEQREALEQWLRRVPDDPGGLLRRKFEYETNLRMRRGEQPQRRKIW